MHRIVWSRVIKTIKVPWPSFKYYRQRAKAKFNLHRVYVSMIRVNRGYKSSSSSIIRADAFGNFELRKKIWKNVNFPWSISCTIIVEFLKRSRVIDETMAQLLLRKIIVIGVGNLSSEMFQLFRDNCSFRSVKKNTLRRNAWLGKPNLKTERSNWYTVSTVGTWREFHPYKSQTESDSCIIRRLEERYTSSQLLLNRSLIERNGLE